MKRKTLLQVFTLLLLVPAFVHLLDDPRKLGALVFLSLALLLLVPMARPT
jgi:hypothetical protein